MDRDTFVQFWLQLPVGYFNNPSERLYWLYLLLAAVLALLISLLQTRQLPSLQSLHVYLTDKDLRLDIGYFVVMWLIKIVLLAPMLLSAHTVATLVLAGYSWLLPPVSLSISYHTLVIAYSVSLFVVSDFTRYWLHRWLHTSRYLFAFHKVHHAAETLNPLTFYRIHPVESLLFGWRYALSAGLVTGVFVGMFQGGFSAYTLLGSNAAVVIFNLIGSNLRHSPIRLSYGKWLEWLLISPSQHQLHHATRYMRHNYGGTLAIWDALFGTLKRSTEVSQPQKLGLGSRQYARYASISDNLTTPLIEIYRLLARNYHQQQQQRQQQRQQQPATEPIVSTAKNQAVARQVQHSR